jgi:Tol biopolymer transport system component
MGACGLRNASFPLLLFVLAAVAVGGCAGDGGPAASGEADPLVEAIVYTSLGPPNWDVYLFEGPEVEPRRLTDDPARDYNAVFSPDGRWVVFTSERAGNPDLWALDLEAGGVPVPLTVSEAMDDAAGFSPDGAQLVFVSTRDGDADIFVMPFSPADAGAEQRAVNVTRRPGGDFNPAFSPDGRSIAYSRQDDLASIGNLETGALGSAAADVYVMDADGSNPRRLSEPGAISGSPAWSEDGGTIWYYRLMLDGVEVRRVALDGTGDDGIGAVGLTPAVMPGGRVAFSQPQPQPGMDEVDILRTGRIFSVEPDGSDLRAESDTTRSWFAPEFDRGSARMLAHGAGPVDGGVTVADGYLFALPDARRTVTLPDRTIEVRGIRGYFPAITPDGDVLSMILPFGPTMPLQISSPDGGGIRPLFAPDPGIAWGAAVARDANTVVVAVGPPFADGTASVDIWKLGVDGSDAVNLTAGVEANDALPHISADGSRIVFRSGGDHGGRIHVMDGDGGNRRRLTDGDALETMPALSPDGEWVVFPTTRVGGWKLWIQRIDGSDGRFLEPDRLDIMDTSMHPRFSPDGEWIVFTSDRSYFNDEWALTWFPQPYGDLWAVPVSGGEAVRLTHNKWEDGPNDWGFARIERPFD